MQSLESSFAGLDARIRTTEARVTRDGQIGAEFDRRFQSLATELSQKVEASRAELAQRLRAVADGRLDGIETTIRDLTGQVDQAEKRSAQAIDRLGREVVSIANSLGERVSTTESRTAAAVEHMGGEMTRIADVMETRLQRADTVQAEALEKLGGEIARIAERLTERMSNSDRRSAEAMDEVADRVERLGETLSGQPEQVSSELSERIRQSEARTAKLLDEARERLDASVLDARLYTETLVAQNRPPPPVEATPAPEPQNADPFTAPAEEVAIHDPFTPELQAGAEPEFLSPEPTEPDPAFISHFEPEPSPHAVPHEYEPEPEPVVVEGASSSADADLLFDPSDDFEPFHPSPYTSSSTALTAEIEPEAEAAFDDFPQAEPARMEPETEASFSVRDFQTGASSQPPPQSTREMIEAARKAARGASGGRNANLSDSTLIPSLETLPPPPPAKGPFGITFPGRKKKGGSGPTLRTMVLASGCAAAITTAAVGAFHIRHDGSADSAAAPRAEATAVSPTDAAEPTPRAPELAVALVPGLQSKSLDHIDPDRRLADVKSEAAETSDASGTTLQTSRTLYDHAVQSIEAGDHSGVEALRRAANLGYGPAQFYLGRLYEAGAVGVSKNLNEARRWTERAAQSGQPAAMYNLASYFYSGEGGAKDPATAAEWFRRAAGRGVVNSQYNLAQLYERGYGVSQSDSEAYKWYLVAAAAGDAEAKTHAEALRRKLPADVQAEAERNATSLHAQTGGGLQTARVMEPSIPATPPPSGLNR